jgi:uncharacterized Zn-binding protein involved in type VI secretion
MGMPAARISDMHVCPMVTPGVPPIPHVGGPILPPGTFTVLIGKLPAATATGMCMCVGPPDTIVKGSTGVFIGKLPAARMGDSCAHGGTIILGCPTVLIGDASPGGGAPSPVVITPVVAALKAAAVAMKKTNPVVAKQINQQATLMEAAMNGTPFCEVCSKT